MRTPKRSLWVINHSFVFVRTIFFVHKSWSRNSVYYTETNFGVSDVGVGETHPCTTSRDAVYLETHCSRLEESVSHQRTRQVTLLFTFLLTHNLFSSCIRRYLVSRACDWVMPVYVSCYLFPVSNSVCATIDLFSLRKLIPQPWFGCLAVS